MKLDPGGIGQDGITKQTEFLCVAWINRILLDLLFGAVSYS